MSFPRYERYKNSGVEWLGEVPEHWQTARFSRIISQIKDGTHGTFARTTGGHLLLSAKNVQDRGLEITEEESYISEEDHLSIVENGFPRRGDLLLTIVGTIGRACIYLEDEPIAFQRSVCFIRLATTVRPGLAYYATQSKFFHEQLQSKSKSSAQAGIYMGDVAAASIVYPTELNEQDRIIKFLDVEVAKIDDLIEEQRRLIELLKEKRQAVISHAVTKGLSSNERMKYSGFEWIGSIPTDWQMKRLKHVKALSSNSFVDGPFGSNLKSEHFIDNGEVYVIESNFATQGQLEMADLKKISMAHFSTIVRSEAKEGDIIIAKIGAQFGKASLLPHIDRKAVVSGNSLKLTVNSTICSNQWALYMLRLSKDQGEIDLLSNGSAQPAVSLGALNNIPFVLPPMSEQGQIVSYLSAITAKIGNLIHQTCLTVCLLQERRSALISAAVTGKIDVRNYTPKEAA